jgi:hypothetical protein
MLIAAEEAADALNHVGDQTEDTDGIALLGAGTKDHTNSRAKARKRPPPLKK